jgi:hypothetical protein
VIVTPVAMEEFVNAPKFISALAKDTESRKSILHLLHCILCKSRLLPGENDVHFLIQKF